MRHVLIPGCFTTAPQAVVIPHPRRHTLSSGACGFTATTDTSATTVYCENVDVPICVYASAQHCVLLGRDNGTDKVVDHPAIDGEPRRLIGHESLSLRGADCARRSAQRRYACRMGSDAPEPQRLVFPLLQNLHSRHSGVTPVSLLAVTSWRCAARSTHRPCRGE